VVCVAAGSHSIHAPQRDAFRPQPRPAPPAPACPPAALGSLGNNTCGYGINEGSAAIVADQGWPTCDVPRGGWKWINTYSSPVANKINWYFYTSPVAGDNPARSLATFWVKLVRNGGATAPWFTLYTPKQANASGWYTTRAHLYGTYRGDSTVLNNDLPIGQEVVMFAQAQPTAEQFPALAGATKFVNYGNFSALTAGQNNNYGQLTGVVVGTQNILQIALSTNSGDETGKQQWTVLAAGYQIAGAAPVTLKTGCEPIGGRCLCQLRASQQGLAVMQAAAGRDGAGGLGGWGAGGLGAWGAGGLGGWGGGGRHKTLP
jgi:hypothetical protein